jgi:transcription antitermination factor NusG
MNQNYRWYALQVRTRFERVVALHVGNKGFEEYLPMYRAARQWSDRVKQIDVPLFPGYVFCKFDINERLPVLMIPGVMSVVNFGGTPFAIPEPEIRGLQNVVGSGLDYEPWPFSSVGQPVQVKFGPLRGLEGLIVEVKKNYRLVISVTLLRRSVSVEIDRDSVTPIGQSAPRRADLIPS